MWALLLILFPLSLARFMLVSFVPPPQPVLFVLHVRAFRLVSRIGPNTATKHDILMVQTHATAKLAKQMTINIQNGWGIVRSLIDIVLQQEDGEYILFKDPQREVLKLIAVPEEDEDEDEDGDEDGEDEDADAFLDDEEFI